MKDSLILKTVRKNISDFLSLITWDKIRQITQNIKNIKLKEPDALRYK